MKPLRNLMEKMEPNFREGGKLHKYWPLYDGMYTFLFVPGHTTHRGTHIRDGIDLKRTMIMVVLALIPALLFGMYNVGHQHYLAFGEAAGFGDKFIYGFLKVLPMLIVSWDRVFVLYYQRTSDQRRLSCNGDADSVGLSSGPSLVDACTGSGFCSDFR
jgi:Na+-transporting NADH:ubiquinone oxidoreductase subunit NqrB